MQTDVAKLKADDFDPLVDHGFVLQGPAGELALKLIEVQRLGRALREGGGFSLLLVSATGPFLPQAIYPLTHPELGVMELFLVPMGPMRGGNAYEVVFT
jgi:hypothetical protein